MSNSSQELIQNNLTVMIRNECFKSNFRSNTSKLSMVTHNKSNYRPNAVNLVSHFCTNSLANASKSMASVMSWCTWNRKDSEMVQPGLSHGIAKVGLEMWRPEKLLSASALLHGMVSNSRTSVSTCRIRTFEFLKEFCLFFPSTCQWIDRETRECRNCFSNIVLYIYLYYLYNSFVAPVGGSTIKVGGPPLQLGGPPVKLGEPGPPRPRQWLRPCFSHTSRGRAWVLRPSGVLFTLLTQSYTQTLGSQSHCHSLTLAHATANHKLSLRSASQPITLTLLTSLNAQLQILHFLCGGHFSIHAPSAAINLMYYIRQIYTRSLG